MVSLNSKRYLPALLSLTAALAFSLNYHYLIEQVRPLTRLEMHESIVRAEAGAPNRYRVLVPWIVQVFSLAVGPWAGQVRGMQIGYLLMTFLSSLGFLYLLYRWCAEWFGESAGVTGMALGLMALVTAMREHTYAPWSIPEAAFCLAGLLLARRDARPATLGLLTIAATLNRETAFLIPLCAGCLATANGGGLSNALRKAGLPALLWLLTVLALRRTFGNAPMVMTAGEIWFRNTRPENLLAGLGNLAMLLGGCWVGLLLGLRNLTPELKRLVPALGVYGAIVMVFGLWREVRLLLPVLPILVPYALAGFYGPVKTLSGDRTV